MLRSVLQGVEGFVDPKVLVGYQTADDAGVYLLSDDIALVQTVDFFTPVVDDPFTYGQIAAANSLSDVYAMGGTPRFALSIVGFPKRGVAQEILLEIMQGGASKLQEAQVAVMGGHSVQDPEIKFGYCITGVIDPAKVRTNAAARPGDRLILTKPIGTGIITTGVKFEKCPESLLHSAVDRMLRLNRTAAAAAERFRVHSMTDVTGYGLLGHAYEMAKASQVTLQLSASSVPLIDGEGVHALAREGMLPGGIESNRNYIGSEISWNGAALVDQQILLDPQTSGGLLISVHPDDAQQLCNALQEGGDHGAEVGEVAERGEALLDIVA